MSKPHVGRRGLVALTRGVSPAFDRCELTHVERQPIDVARARRQHRDYELCLQELGCHLESLPAQPDYPDSVFVEDLAVVLEGIAVISRPGALSRRGERSSIAKALEKHRRLAHLKEPGALDGGDVLQVDKDLFVGLSRRTNQEGIDQLRGLVGPSGYTVTEVEFTGCLHLKSAATLAARETLLINPDWVDAAVFDRLRVLTIDPGEPAAANALLVGDRALLPEQYPRTLARLRRAGVEARAVDISELIKAEAGVTCCSLVFRTESSRNQGHETMVDASCRERNFS